MELSDINLTETTGINGKIRKLIIENVKCRKIKIRTIEKEKNYNNYRNSLSARYANYNKTYEINVYKYVYSKNNLIKWFKENKIIKFNRKDVEIDTETFINKIKGV